MAKCRSSEAFFCARKKGLLSFQCCGTTGSPNTAARTLPRGAPDLAAASNCCGDSVIRAALCALTAENISGCAKAKRSAPYPPMEMPSMARSEEHTSELQSQFHLVCRLLLEKK